jgi:hypothetical protein
LPVLGFRMLKSELEVTQHPVCHLTPLKNRRVSHLKHIEPAAIGDPRP